VRFISGRPADRPLAGKRRLLASFKFPESAGVDDDSISRLGLPEHGVALSTHRDLDAALVGEFDHPSRNLEANPIGHRS
jgi:hypothetical protein